MTTPAFQETIKIELLAAALLQQIGGTGPGHCARVDFLELDDALALCQYLRANEKLPAETIVGILSARHEPESATSVLITPDRAIELRNRKRERLCLFIPVGNVDATASSLANSFAPIDGRHLYETALRSLLRRLKQTSLEAAISVQSVFNSLRQWSGLSHERRLDFASTALALAQAGTPERIGLELWRLGLISDARSDFMSDLPRNRRLTRLLARPKKFDATLVERIQELKVDRQTEQELQRLLRGKALNEVHSWSRELAEAGLTLDRWRFLDYEKSDLREFEIVPFTNRKGVVEHSCHLGQPDGPGGALYAYYKGQGDVVVRWKCKPDKPRNLAGWRVAILPEESEPGFRESLWEQDFTPGRRKVTLKLEQLNLSTEEPPDSAVCVRIAPLGPDGNELVDERGNILYQDSQPFNLIPEEGTLPERTPREKRQTVPTLAFGRLKIGSEIKETVLEESLPQWQHNERAYFSVLINGKHRLTVALSETLSQLEQNVLENPRQGGCFTLEVDDLRPARLETIKSFPLASWQRAEWQHFWNQRELFFRRVRQPEARNLIEVADWSSPELGDAAVRYAQAYQALVQKLIEQDADTSEIRQALSLDNLLVRFTNQQGQVEEALVILPTHPLRVAWVAGYARLLAFWEDQLLEQPKQARTQHVDLQALRLLMPANVPPFAYHAATSTSFIFFQNLLFFHGVALPADVPGAHRRYADVATILNASPEQADPGDIRPEGLSEHLKLFQTLHPYADPLVLTLINPDRGNVLAEALKGLAAQRSVEEDDEEMHIPSLPLLQLVSYSEARQSGTLRALVRALQQNGGTPFSSSARQTDHFLPALTTTARSFEQLESEEQEEQSDPQEAHLAIVNDLLRPQIVSLPIQSTTSLGNEVSSFSLHGLLTRFIPQFFQQDETLLWRYQIRSGGAKPLPHPGGPRYSESLVNLQTTLLRAGGYLLNGNMQTQPALQVHLSAERRQLLERLHQRTNWVITLDRFFTLDYYDSPHLPGLQEMARKYVLDYSPEFTEGLGHRMMVTTAWHEEISSMLGQAMEELGFSKLEESVSHLLHYLKTISGRLALEVLASPSSAAAAVGLGAVTAWLERQGRLKQAVLLPVDLYPRIFAASGRGEPASGERRCDLVLITLKQNIVEAAFIEVKWRRGAVPLERLASDMALQMQATAEVMRRRFFDPRQIDGALQRAYLANVLRFYFERARRYGLFDPQAEGAFQANLARLEKAELAFRPSYEGYIASFESQPRREPLTIEEARIRILTASDFRSLPQLLSEPAAAIPIQNETEIVDASEEPPGGLPFTAATADRKLTGQTPELNGPDWEPRDDQPDELEATLLTRPTAPADAANPPELQILLGHANSGPIFWQPGIKGSPHLFILGIPGQGKSWTIEHLLSELGQQGVPALVLDFHGQFANPQGRYYQSVHPRVLDAAQGLPFSPLECAAGDEWRNNAWTIAEIFAQVVGLGPMQRDIVYNAIRNAYQAHGFEGALSEEALHELSYPSLAEIARRIEQEEQRRHISNVIPRCRPLLEMDLFRPGEQPVSFYELISQGLVIDIHRLQIEQLQLSAGAFVLHKLYKDMFRWGDADRLRLAIVLDEAHRLARDTTLPRLMKEGRKFGIAVIVASQGLNDFHPDVTSTAGTKMIFRMNHPESRKAAGLIGGSQSQNLAASIEQLAVGSAYVQTPAMKWAMHIRLPS